MDRDKKSNNSRQNITHRNKNLAGSLKDEAIRDTVMKCGDKSRMRKGREHICDGLKCHCGLLYGRL